MPNSSTRKIYVRGLELQAEIGCLPHEQGVTQPVRIDVEVTVIEPDDPLSDSLEDVVCYGRLCQHIEELIAQGHIKLVETLAEQILDMILQHPMTLAARICVEKPNAIAHADAAGVEISRAK